MSIADTALTSRLESIVVEDVERFIGCARELYPDTRAQAMRVGEGIMLYGAEEIPFNEVVGMGITRPVTGAELDLIEAFYDDRGSTTEMLVCTNGDPGLLSQLVRRGWQPTGFEDVLILPIEAGSIDPLDPGEIEIRVVGSNERELWADRVAKGFSETGKPSERECRFSRIIASRRDATLVWAWTDGVPVATGELVVTGDVGWLSADTTDPAFRGRGIQQALQRFRIALAREAGCGIAVSEAAPGGSSHRNMERLGFRVAYTHLLMEKQAPS